MSVQEDPVQGVPAPTQAAPDAGKGRRRFIEILLGGGLLASAVSFLYPVLRYLNPPTAVDPGADSVTVGKVGEFKPNSGMIFRFGNQPALLVRTAEGEFKAFTAKCTHLDCTVQYRGDMKRIWCACHNGMYDLNGRNIAGPPPRPLKEFEVHVQSGEVIVRRHQEA